VHQPATFPEACAGWIDLPVMALSVSKSASHCGAKKDVWTVDGVTMITAEGAAIQIIVV
jgi:hypothetical protein